MKGYLNNLLNAVTSTGAGSAVQIVAAKKTFQAKGATSAGSGAATVKVEGSNDGTYFEEIGTITLTLGTDVTSGGFASDAPWAYIRGNVTALSGTNAYASLTVSY